MVQSKAILHPAPASESAPVSVPVAADPSTGVAEKEGEKKLEQEVKQVGNVDKGDDANKT